MPDAGYIAVFLVGLLGGTHCIGMCGGIVSAFAVQTPGAGMQWRLNVAYNLGRISTYALAGAVLGVLGGAGMMLNGVLPVQMALYVIANLMLIALGLYLTGFTRVLAITERAGQRLWAHVRPLTARLLPARSVTRASALGLLWGLLPCGMVYSVLATALVAGSAARGAGLMLAFGLGTLPNLLLAGVFLTRLRAAARSSAMRMGAGLVVLGFGLYGLVHASTLGGRLWQGVVCHV